MLHDKQKGDAMALGPDIFVAAPAVLDRVLPGVKLKFSKLPGFLQSLINSTV